jgi:predicted metal-dependent hydrolase
MSGWPRRAYPVGRVEQGIDRLLGWVERRLPAKFQLALTVALEHFSCLLSDRFLRAEGLQASLLSCDAAVPGGALH